MMQILHALYCCENKLKNIDFKFNLVYNKEKEIFWIRGKHMFKKIINIILGLLSSAVGLMLAFIPSILSGRSETALLISICLGIVAAFSFIIIGKRFIKKNMKISGISFMLCPALFLLIVGYLLILVFLNNVMTFLGYAW